MAGVTQLGGAPAEALRARADALLSAAFDTEDDVFVARALGGRLSFLGISDPDSLGWRAAELAASYNECGQA